MEGTTGYWLTQLVLQRSLGLVYLLAFSVVVNQFRPLCGEKGLLPVGQFLRQTSLTESPSIFFMFPHDSAFAVCGWLGMALSVLAATGLSERFGDLFSMVVWTLLWLLYLSYVNIGQTFYAFGWESLLKNNPFPDAPPHSIRATYYRYHFTTPAERTRTGFWWRREQVGNYFPAVSLADPAFRQLLAGLGWLNE